MNIVDESLGLGVWRSHESARAWSSLACFARFFLRLDFGFGLQKELMSTGTASCHFPFNCLSVKHKEHAVVHRPVFLISVCFFGFWERRKAARVGRQANVVF
jgi:hypothetical protein